VNETMQGRAEGHGPEQEVRNWLHGWGAEVASRDFDAGQRRMADDVVGFGTRATVARGAGTLRAQQWEHVWPSITDFAFDVDGADVWISPDALHAAIGTAWTSSGYTESGERFPRGGRATVVVTRETPDGAWLGRHTHFSLEPTGPGTHTGRST
jgi:ketosteroid isomerase-like protein